MKDRAPVAPGKQAAMIRLTVGRNLLGLAALLAGLGVAPAPSRGEEVAVLIENIRVGFSRDSAGQFYKVGRWVPVQVDLQAGPETFRGELVVRVSDDDGTPTDVVEPVEIPARTTSTVTTYVRPGTSSAEFEVRVQRSGQRRPVDSKVLSDPLWLEPGQTVIATLGNPEGLDLIPTLPEYKLENSVQDSLIRIVPIAVPGGIPTKWYGYDGVDVVVLDTNDQQALDALDQFRNLALKEWVRNGGHLIVTVGERWLVVNESFLADMLPARPNGQDRTRDTGGIEAFAGSNKTITGPEGPEVALTRLVPLPERAARELDVSVGGAVVVRGAYGFGRVTVVGLDVDRAPFRDWVDRGRFWVKTIDLGPRNESTMQTGPGGAFFSNEMNDLSSYLHKSMEQFEGIRLIPFAWVAFFVFVYILLIGPGDYFFLKKVLKRMELTWITFPTIVLAVSLLAYATAYAVKGTDLRINRVDVVDVDQGFGNAQGQFLTRGHSYSTIFSPKNSDYRLAALPLPLNKAAGNEGVVAEPSAERTGGIETISSFFGVIENRFGGMTAGGRSGIGSAPYRYGPLSGQTGGSPQAMIHVRIPIWTSKSIESTWFDAEPEAIQADLTRTGADRLEGKVTNRLDRPLKRAMIAFGRQAYTLERPIEPGETVSLLDFSNQNLGGYLERIQARIPKIQQYQWDSTQLDVGRSDLARALMFNRAGRGKGLKPNIVLKDLDLSTQLELGRPILVAELDGPASELVLGVRPGRSPKVAQTTLLRVILPPAKD